jgi:hypothetical protein
MGFFTKLFGKAPSTGQLVSPPRERPDWMVDGMRATLYRGSETLDVAGESHHQDNLWRIVGHEPTEARVQQDCVAILVAERDNPYDANAISVWVNGLLVGYLPKDAAVDYRPGLLKLSESGPVALSGAIVGGGYGGKAILGVFLNHDPRDFGLDSDRPLRSEMRTGLSEAMATDQWDDSYNLSWLEGLSDDTRAAVTQLRHLLEDETDLLDRHFMYSELESRLYKMRDVDEKALTEYDEACHSHDSEMDSIRLALLEKFGDLPLLETYKQQAIRQQKAKNWDEGLRWTRRGLYLYGDSAHNQDWVNDLKKRAAHFDAKIAAGSVVVTRQKKPAEKRKVEQVEILTCSQCGRSWERVKTRGRKPLICPLCTGGT